MILALECFVMMCLLDWMWARYIKAVAENKAVISAGYSAAIVLIGGLVTLAYVENAWMLIPTAVGAFVGTFLASDKKD